MYTLLELQAIQDKLAAILTAHSTSRLSAAGWQGTGTGSEAPVTGTTYLTGAEFTAYTQAGFIVRDLLTETRQATVPASQLQRPIDPSTQS